MSICSSYRLAATLFFTGLLITGSFEIVKAQAPKPTLLWQIGRPDDELGEFAAPSGREVNWEKDGLFVVGKSHEKSDWPFAHPGPDDAWAGNKPHSYAIVFGIKQLVSGEDNLIFKLIDVGYRDVALAITVNGRPFHATLPKGAGRAILGDVREGKRYQFEIPIPAGLLKKGDNTVGITNESGSWFVYDWIGLEAPAGNSLQNVRPGVSILGIKSLPFISTHGQRCFQSEELSLVNTGKPSEVAVELKGTEPQHFLIGTGNQSVEILVPEVSKDSSVDINIAKKESISDRLTAVIQPVKKMTIYVLPHSHNDIGYTEIQTSVEKKQIKNLLTGIDYSQKTKDYPAGARFIWNLEGTYAANLYLQRMNESQKRNFYAAVADGGVALNGMYVNTLTGLCRPEELLQLFSYSAELAKKTRTTVDAAMISDVPGYTWGTVTAMAQAGIKYFSVAPNNFDRIGDILEKWEDKPFYWVSPSGKEKVLVWIPYRGYALSHGIDHPNADFVSHYYNKLKSIDYPYDITYIRWSGHGDNAVPDMEISDFVKKWNTRYTWPRFIISSTSTAFSAFEKKFGEQLPRVKGDWTGYWEDGAASSAFETAENRTSSLRLSQAEALWSMINPGAYPSGEFKRAWQNVLLYSEHTWGADVSVTRPLSQKTMEQWQIKKSYADTAANLSTALLDGALGEAVGGSPAISGSISVIRAAASKADTIEVFNTNSWQRSNLVLVAPGLSVAGDLVKDAQGNVLPSQRLSTGELAFVAKDIPSFAANRFFISAGKRVAGREVSVTGNSLDNGIVHIAIDETTGAITTVRNHTIDNNFADSATGNYLNDYLYLHGNRLTDLQRNGAVRISVKEKGPVLSTLLIESTDVPGCQSLTREIRLVNGFDYVEMVNILDKKPAELDPVPGDYPWANTEGKESVNFGFPFYVPGGEIKLDIPMAIMRPETDQLPGSCKNWLEVGQWADVSNKDFGITWATLDAPLVEVGGITATLLGGQTNPGVWRKKIEPTQKLYSWALNNHWETNYRAYQDGLITLRYALRPHTAYEPVAATKFATGLSQPLVVARSTGKDWSVPRLQLSGKDIVALVFKPSEDGKAWILTLYNPSEKSAGTDLHWSSPIQATYYSNTGEGRMGAVNGAVGLGPREVVTLRVER